MQRHLRSTEISERDGAVVTRARDLSLFKLVAAMSAPRETARSGEDLGNIGVLLIEEGDSVAAAMKDGLRQRGFNVWSTSSYVLGLELHLAISADVDIVILDAAQDVSNARYAMHLVRRVNPDVNICIVGGAPSRRQLADLLNRRSTCVIERPLPHINTIADRLWLLASADGLSKAK